MMVLHADNRFYAGLPVAVPVEQYLINFLIWFSPKENGTLDLHSLQLCMQLH
jgi:hypothetical protein